MAKASTVEAPAETATDTLEVQDSRTERSFNIPITDGAIRASDLSFLAFPGQTVWHEPPAVTWQLGEPAILAERFGVRGRSLTGNSFAA